MEETLVPFHVPQQSRRHKLRFTPENDVVLQLPVFSSSQSHQPPLLHEPLTAATSGLNLSLSTHTRFSGAYNATPMGPFTGYASILARSRFLKPAQEILEDFSRTNGVLFEKEGSKILEDHGISWFDDDDDDDDISRRCNNPSLVSMLREVYKRYKVYCQQMQSAVTSFESVAGLGNAAPFICFAIKAMFRHFLCLKNAILDHIHVTSKVIDIRKDHTSGSCSEDKGRYEQKQVPGSSFLQHPVWRSQRGFPDKAVAVLRNWLFEHFLHPYPSDSDKQMLAQKTGLSRSQVSNWFTNARVRLWKPMVEEMHALERKTQCSKASETPKFFGDLTNHPMMSSMQPQLSQKDFQGGGMYTCHRDDEDNQYKRSRIEEVFPRAEQSKEQFGMPCNHHRLPNNQAIDVGGSQTGAHISQSSNHDSTTGGLLWSSQAQILPFWLAK